MKSKNLLIQIIAPILIAIVGIVLLFTVGFNYTDDVRGCSVAEINLTEQYDYDEARIMIETALEGEEVDVLSYVSAENQYGDTIIVKFRSESLDLEAFENRLFEEFGYNSADAFESKYISVGDDLEGQNILNVFSYTLLGCLIALVAVAIFVGARFGLGAVMTLVLEVICDLVLMNSLVLIARIGVGMYYGVALAFTFVFAVINWAMMLSKFRENVNSENYANMSNFEVAELSMKETRKVTALMAIVCAIVLAVVGVCLSVEATHACLASIAGILPVLYISQTISPALWAITAKRKPKVKKEKKEVV